MRALRSLAASLWLGAALAAAGFGPAAAQGVQDFPLGSPVAPQSPLVTLDQDRLFTQSTYGQRVARELDAASEALATENRGLEAALSAEERALTEQRPTLEPGEFRRLADAFDDKVTRTRREQDAKARALTRRAELERDAFLGRVLPILSRIVSDRGAVAILDDRAVLLSAESIDITDDAVARIDAELGDGSDLPPVQVPEMRTPDLAVPEAVIRPGDAGPDGGGEAAAPAQAGTQPAAEAGGAD